MPQFIAYLDEFGHIGPFVDRHHPQHNTSPVFGFGGFIIEADRARDFAAWFYKVKNDLLAWEIANSGKSAVLFEKKGSALYTTYNVEKYAELRRFTTRFLNAFERFDAKVFWVGVEKERVDPPKMDADGLYTFVLREALKRLNQEAEARGCTFLVVLDEHPSRDRILTMAGISMFGTGIATQLLEPPFQVESHRFQTIQAADWICGLVGRLGAYWADRAVYNDFAWSHNLYKEHLLRVSVRSGIRSMPAKAVPVIAAPDAAPEPDGLI